MLIRFTVKNFSSFRDETIFSMSAGQFRRHPSHVIDINGHPILKGAFLFGANASGKSNFVRAVAFARNLVRYGIDEVDVDRKYFRLSPNGHEDEGLFQFDIFIKGGLFYSYMIAISYSKACIIGEMLMANADGEDPKCVFAYEVGADGVVNFESDFTLEDEDARRFEVYREDAEAVQKRKESFLSEIAKRAVKQRTSHFFNHFRNVYRWFGKLLVLFPDSRYEGFDYIEDVEDRVKLGELLHAFDTGIDSLQTENADMDKILSVVPEKKREEMKARFIRNLTGEHKSDAVGLRTGDNSYMVTYDGQRLVAKKIVANHGIDGESFEREDESDGTKRLFDILPLRDVFSSGRVVIVDELDRSLHTKATTEFIKMFYRAAEGHQSQLIATTHDHNILDLDMLRQDEIWFVERDKEHCSRLFPLTQFKARFDQDIRKDYLLGRYGALPILGDLSNDDTDAERET